VHDFGAADAQGRLCNRCGLALPRAVADSILWRGPILQEVVPGYGASMRPVTDQEAALFAVCEPGLDGESDQRADP
jgi:hypothetical protein